MTAPCKVATMHRGPTLNTGQNFQKKLFLKKVVMLIVNEETTNELSCTVCA